MEEILRLRDHPELAFRAADWFHAKWGIPRDAYEESITACLNGAGPQWYVVMAADEIIGGLGVIENDFHDRTDLTPNVCAVYVEPAHRNRGIAGRMLDFVCRDMADLGVGTLYLLTDHDSFYERYGWSFYCTAMGDGEEESSRMYRKNTELSK